MELADPPALVDCGQHVPGWVEFPLADTERPLGARFEAIVERHPDRPAVRTGSADLTDLGGHSLLATQLLARLLRRFQVEVPLGALLFGATVARMALALERAHGVVATDPEVAALAADIARLRDDEARRRIEAELRAQRD